MLHDLLGLDMWFVTRVRLDEWIVTHFRGDGPIARGHALPVAAEMRERILRGQLPKRASEGALAEPSATTDVARLSDASAYVGAPLVVKDQLYGVLCGLDRSGTVADERADAPHLMTAARILSTVIGHELEADELLRRAERAEAEALVDELTGLFNRRGWDRLVEREETRSIRYGHGSTVFMMDLDGLKRVNDERGHAAGDLMLRSVADALRSVVREHDVAARLGGDEFAVLAVESDDDQARGMYHRMLAAFAAAGVEVSIGTARREYDGGIAGAVDRADAEMYQRKAERGTS